MPPQHSSVERTGELFALHADRVRRYAHYRLWVYGYPGDRDSAADDITQEVFACWLARVRGGQALPPENDASHQLAYLLVTARNLCADLAHGYERQRECVREMQAVQVTAAVTQPARFAPLWPSLATLLALLRVALYAQSNTPGISTYDRTWMLANMRARAVWEARSGGMRHRWS